ncbi:MAG: hypothetical protein IPJ17_05355 [Holophagales bacterium]|nr:MAG: hypothetical protein IPJ17_05355 [Holophagales bacterium]
MAEFLRWRGPWARLSRRTIRAALLSTFAFYLLTRVSGRWEPRWFLQLNWTLCRLLDLPISALNALLPDGLQAGFAGQFRRATYCFPGTLADERLRYLAVGIPAWTLVLYGLEGVSRRVRLGLRQKGQGGSAAAT